MNSSSALTAESPYASYPEVDWSFILSLPIDEWEKVVNPRGLRQFAEGVSKVYWNKDDKHFADRQCAVAIMRLLRIMAKVYLDNEDRFQQENGFLQHVVQTVCDTDEACRNRVTQLFKENEYFKVAFGHGENQAGVCGMRSPRGVELSGGHGVRDITEKYEKHARELDRLKDENEQLRRTAQFCEGEKASVVQENAKLQLEYKHLVAKHKRVIEKHNSVKEMLRETRRSEVDRLQDDESELKRLRQKVRELQLENHNLIQLRNRAEELCEQREMEALKDMTELQKLHHEVVDEERNRVQILTEELSRKQRDIDRRATQVVVERQRSPSHLREDDDKRHDMGKNLPMSNSSLGFGVMQSGGTAKRSSPSARNSSNLAGTGPFRLKASIEERDTQILVADIQRLQQENDRLSVELQQMELRAEAREEEIVRINRLIKNYERGDEGLRRLRCELETSTRTLELLREENSQLRERLNAMTDSLTFSSALQELCIRVGVTQEEIERLRPRSTLYCSEVEMLKAEVITLKEEVDWLERERRHWMDRVRLQPLLDTKLRLELGLNPEQLKQLDKIVGQMKVGRVIVEEAGEENYKEKYFQELRLRRKEMEHFNDFVKQRMEEVLRELSGKTDFSSSVEATSALQRLRDRVDIIAANRVADENGEGAADTLRLREQLQSALQLLEQSELTIKDNAATQTTLREQLAATTAERDMLLDERDKYRSAFFEGLVFDDTVEDSPQILETKEGAVDNLGPPRIPSSAEGAFSPPSFPEGCNCGTPVHSSSLNYLKRTFENQLRKKDELITSLKSTVDVMKDQLSQQHAVHEEMKQKCTEASSQQEDVRNQVAALQEMNRELTEKLNERTNILKDVEGTIQRMESVNTRELLQKIVLLRQRETKLLQRLRRVMEMHGEASKSERSMREYVNTVFKSLKEALENTSTGFVLPRSSSSVCIENDVIDEMQQRLGGILRGRLFREDSTYLLHLQRVYRNMEHIEELKVLRLEVQNQRAHRIVIEEKLEEQRVELECLRRLRDTISEANEVKDGPVVGGGAISSVTRWESEVTTWQQKCNLYMKRCEDKEREVSTIEAQLGDARRELALLHEHIDNSIGSGTGTSGSGVPAVCSTPQDQQNGVAKEQRQQQEGAAIGHNRELGGIMSEGSKIYQLEREVARLKSINLGVLHYSLDLQGECKRLEIELEATKQELSLVRDAGNSQRLSDFVSAAIRQHSALRCQSELAVLQLKQARMQLHAMEANLRVAVNEATTYKLNAFRLYRKYVEQTVAVVDYVRSEQRCFAGALSPHRTEILHKRLMDAITDNERSQAIQSELAAQLAEARGTAALLQQQLELLKVKDGEGRVDALHAKLLASLSAVRDKDVKIVELREDCSFLQQKLKRAETHVQQLTEEISRLELNGTTLTAADGEAFRNLLQLKESVFSKSESPAVVIQQGDFGQRHQHEAVDMAAREYNQVMEKQGVLVHECDLLKKQLKEEGIAARKVTAENDALKGEVGRLRERLQNVQQQLHDERQRAEERERRVIRSHEAQAEVSHRAAEHHSRCLQDMLKSKDMCIEQLQGQLQAERRKYLECQVEESTRMERLHERLFKENSAMVERFREAINGAAEQYEYGAQLPDAGEPASGVSEHVAVLTKEVLRLRAELRNARTANIMLESRLSDQVADARRQQQHFPSVSGCPTEAERQHSHRTPQVPPSGATPAVDIIDDQSVVIANLRQRELALTDELQRAHTERDLLAQQLYEARNLTVEQGGVLKSVVAAKAAKSGVVETELRAQLSFLETQLAEAREKLDEERREARRLQTDTDKWREQLDSLREEIIKQQNDVERARRLVAMNERLNADIHHMEEQNEKLIIATNLLKQRLVDEAQERDSISRKHQHEMALAQRMGNIQQESSEHLKSVNLRLQSIQKELEEKVRREEETLRKHEEVQQLAYELHLQLQEKEHEILRLKRELAAQPPKVSLQGRRSPKRMQASHERGTQVLQTVQENGEGEVLAEGPWKVQQQRREGQELCQRGYLEGRPLEVMKSPREPLLHPALADSTNCSATPVVGSHVIDQSQVAAVARSEVEGAQRDNLNEISSLRALVSRQARDLKDVSEQLRGERDINKTLRSQLLSTRKELETRELGAVRETAILHQSLDERGKRHHRPSGVEKGHFSNPSALVSPLLQAAAGSNTQLIQQMEAKIKENEELQRQVEMLKSRLDSLDDAAQQIDFYKKELEELRRRQVNTPDCIQPTSPAGVRASKRAVLKLEAVIESLQRELRVENEVRFRSLEQRVAELIAENQRLTVELNRYQVIPTTAVTAPALNVLTSMKPSDQNSLERELLEKNGIILDLRFEREALQLKVSRLERHLDDVLKADSINMRVGGAHKERGRVEALETLVENMKVVVERLQQENSVLKSKTVSVAKHMDLVRELRELRSREKQLLEQSEKLSRRLLDSSMGGSAMSEQQARLQKRLQAAELTAERYRAEVQELRQRFKDVSSVQEGDTWPYSESQQKDSGDVHETEDRRCVQPLPLLDSDLPPPLPRAPSF
ncbi:hypothetical protein, conserved [Trypanosoma brucei gambiense DAL972]|uniref:Uncharacterized protein n=1 Tax=Trypanosoma brucei gambiense (strain MHOM/CI/86/DAL972) TaxID=679716 RepID=D0A2D9_TRYB9|nr:hypothetical protein, conserved [Trypanosoma brucei gambiense DAL972]CBH15433.1 hypothetical protein, conserved [Trypanosoma brucei gambiense DAL972]|eukprot:XP_011777697.1 hypothetical protein, conserved [Trypanosoma brucei gambiense DAL972]